MRAAASPAAGRIAQIQIHYDGAPPVMMAKERDTALRDLADDSLFQPLNDNNGPYRILLSAQHKHIVLNIKNSLEEDLPAIGLSLGPYRRIIRDYFLMIESYEKTRIDGNRSKLEAIDMGRRGLHDEAAALLLNRLKDKITMDQDTARRLFTLICVLHLGQVRL